MLLYYLQEKKEAKEEKEKRSRTDIHISYESMSIC